MIRPLAAVLLALGLVVVGSAPATSQDSFPSRPITIINPFPPGGTADLTGRPLAAALERILKQPVVITNKPGAAGAVGMQSAAVAKPDGYTIVIAVPSISTIPEVDKVFGRPPAFNRDQFVPLALVTADPTIIVVNADQPWKSVKDLLEDAKKRPGEITYSSSGIYGASHVPMEWVLQVGGGLKMRHLPTPGGGPAMTAVLGSHAQLWCSPPGVASAHIKSGKVRALAVTGATRHPHFPDVPTLKELGHDVDYYLWVGMFAPKGTPPAVVKTLREAIKQAVEDAQFKSAMEKIQTPISYKDGDEFRTWWDTDAARLAEVIKRIGRIETK
jgi:tripartite-type tricarboxylate transporter receptor subunit TctC